MSSQWTSFYLIGLNQGSILVTSVSLKSSNEIFTSNRIEIVFVSKPKNLFLFERFSRKRFFPVFRRSFRRKFADADRREEMKRKNGFFSRSRISFSFLFERRWARDVFCFILKATCSSEVRSWRRKSAEFSFCFSLGRTFDVFEGSRRETFDRFVDRTSFNSNRIDWKIETKTRRFDEKFDENFTISSAKIFERFGIFRRPKVFATPADRRARRKFQFFAAEQKTIERRNFSFRTTNQEKFHRRFLRNSTSSSCAENRRENFFLQRDKFSFVQIEKRRDFILRRTISKKIPQNFFRTNVAKRNYLTSKNDAEKLFDEQISTPENLEQSLEQVFLRQQQERRKVKIRQQVERVRSLSFSLPSWLISISSQTQQTSTFLIISLLLHSARRDKDIFRLLIKQNSNFTLSRTFLSR